MWEKSEIISIDPSWFFLKKNYHIFSFYKSFIWNDGQNIFFLTRLINNNFGLLFMKKEEAEPDPALSPSLSSLELSFPHISNLSLE